MKAFVLLLSMSAVVIADKSMQDVDEEAFINWINSKQNLWKAGKSHMTLEEMVQRLGFVKSKSVDPKLLSKHDYQMPADGIPENFDAREKWPDCPIDAIQDQSNCGSCWAVSTAKAFADRLCIASKYKIKVNISAQEITSCCTECGKGCNEGDPYKALEFIRKHGVVTGGDYGSHEGCQPYLIKPCSNDPSEGLPPCPPEISPTPACRKTCYNHKYNKTFQEDKHYGKSAYFIVNVTDMQIEIMTNGPLVATYDVYEDFFLYHSGIYKHVSEKKIDGHCVRVIGWGVERGIPYWLVANSMRRHFGENGYFRILRGSNECNFEAYVTAAHVKLK